MNEITLRRPFVLTAMSAAALLCAATAGAQVPDSTDQTAEPPAETRTMPPEAQTQPSDATPAPRAGAQTPIDDAKLDQFADAYVAVQTIQANASDRLNKTADDPEQQQQAQADVENEMIAAVERTGLKIEEFNGIVQSMSADPDLRARVVAKIRERMRG